MSGRSTSDIVAEWLSTEAGIADRDGHPGALLDRVRSMPQERYLAQRVFGDATGRVPVVRLVPVLLVLVGLLAAIAGVGAVLRENVIDRPSVVLPSLVVPKATIWPGYKVLRSDQPARSIALDDPAVSIQVPGRWTPQQSLRSGDDLIRARIGSAGMTVSRLRMGEIPFEDAVATFTRERGAADGWTSFTRTDGIHGSHRAALITLVRGDGAFNEQHYLVEGSAGAVFLVSIAWDPGHDPDEPELDFDPDVMRGSFNPDGPGPAFVEPVRRSR